MVCRRRLGEGWRAAGQCCSMSHLNATPERRPPIMRRVQCLSTQIIQPMNEKYCRDVGATLSVRILANTS